MTEIVKKVKVACAFGTPTVEITKEIVDEVQALVNKVTKARKLVDEINPYDHGALTEEKLTDLKAVLDG